MALTILKKKRRRRRILENHYRSPCHKRRTRPKEESATVRPPSTAASSFSFCNAQQIALAFLLRTFIFQISPQTRVCRIALFAKRNIDRVLNILTLSPRLVPRFKGKNFYITRRIDIQPIPTTSLSSPIHLSFPRNVEKYTVSVRDLPFFISPRKRLIGYAYKTVSPAKFSPSLSLFLSLNDRSQIDPDR